MLKYATLCSGIEGFGAALDRLGMQCVYQCEQDKQCQRVINHHWPEVEKGFDVNDSRTAADIVRLAPDLIAFGSPCQDLSLAGKRRGLAGERSGVFFRCVELCFACAAEWVVWENVPGVFSSNGGKDFAAVLEAFTGFVPEVPKGGWKNSGACIGPLYGVAWRVLNLEWWRTPQRRRRVFLVGNLRDRGRPFKVLFESDCMPWDSPPRRKTGTEIADGLEKSTANGCGIARPLKSGANMRHDESHETYITHPLNCSNSVTEDGRGRGIPIITHTLRAEGHDASEDGTGRGVPLVFDERNVTSNVNRSACRPGDPVPTMHSSPMSVAYAIQERAVSENDSNGPQGKGFKAEQAYTLEARQHAQSVACGGVRKLTPVECLRLQSFPDNYLDLDPPLSDSAKYKMIGNSVAPVVAEWIGRRIIEVDKLQ